MEIEEEITDDEEKEIEEEVVDLRKKRRPVAAGLVLTIFAAIVLIMIGGLASYYYYSIQSQGTSSEKVLKRVWADTTTDGTDVTDKFSALSKFEDLAGAPGTDLAAAVSTANRDARDDAIDVTALTGLNMQASDAASKLNKFLVDYAAYMTELRRLIDHNGDIAADTDFDTLTSDSKTVQTDYDALLLAGKGIVSSNLPPTIFDIPGDFLRLYTGKTGTTAEVDATTKATQQAAEGVVAQFVTAWKARNGDGMKAVLTNGAKGEFNAGILEDSTDTLGFRVTTDTVADDGASVTIIGQLDQQTPDQVKVSPVWKFVLLKQGDKWLIDSWKAQG